MLNSALEYIYKTISSSDGTHVVPDEVIDLGDGRTSIWRKQFGKKKLENLQVLTLTVTLDTRQEGIRALALNGIKKLKTLKHPSILKFLFESQTSAKISFSTEWGFPLVAIGDSLPQPDYILWGILKVLQALEFLHTECQISHGNICESAIYVTQSGEWKLGDFEWAYKIGEAASVERAVSMTSLRPETSHHPPEGYMHPREIRQGSYPVHAQDMWRFGIVARDLLRRSRKCNGVTQKYINIFDKLERSLEHSFLSGSPLKRSGASAFIAQILAPGGCLDTKFIRLMNRLEDISVRSDAERRSDFESLREEMKNFHPDLKKYKILPLLSNALEYSDSDVNLAESLLDAAQDCSDFDLDTSLKAAIRKLTQSKDSSVRSAAIEKLHLVYPKSNKTPYSSDIAELVTSYLRDPSPYIRDKAIRSSVNYTNFLSQKDHATVLTSLYELLKDPETGIRVNTIICFAKTFMLYPPHSNRELVMSVFINTLRDSSHEVRVASVSSLATTADLYSEKDLIATIIPKLLPCALDPESSVRNSFLLTVQTLISRLAHLGDLMHKAAPRTQPSFSTPSERPACPVTSASDIASPSVVPSVLITRQTRSSSALNGPPRLDITTRNTFVDTALLQTSPNSSNNNSPEPSPSFPAQEVSDGWDSFLF